MGENSSIEWTTHTFNPWRGCTKVSPGCAHCYAEKGSARNPSVLGGWGPNGKRVVAAESMWRKPLKWDRDAAEAGQRHRVFCASFADVFEAWDGPMHNAAGHHLGTWGGAWPWPGGNGSIIEGEGFRALTMDDVRLRLWDLILYGTPNLDWLLLTKRPENVLPTLKRMHALRKTQGYGDDCLAAWIDGSHPPDNVWLGVSVEDRSHGLPRIEVLRAIPARLRFLSIEPLLEDLGEIDLTGIHWVIVGGESGTKARSMSLAWAQSIRRQCQRRNVPFLFKQWGSYEPVEFYYDQEGDYWPVGGDPTHARLMDGTVMPYQRWDNLGGSPVAEFFRYVGKKAAGRLLDGRTWDEFPEVI